MKQAQKVTTRFPIASDLEPHTIKRLSDLINEVYDNAESGMWKRSGTRTTPAEVERLLRAQALILAEIDGVLVGSVNVNLLSDGVGEFGMLVADRNTAEYASDRHWSTTLSSGPANTRVTPCALSSSRPALDTSEQDFSAAVVLEDWVRAPNYRTVRNNAPGVSAQAGNRVRLHCVAQALGLTTTAARQPHTTALQRRLLTCCARERR